MTGPQAAYLSDGRLHLHHGPIDLIVSAEGPERRAALNAAVARFEGLLDALVVDLEVLRQRVRPTGNSLGAVSFAPSSTHPPKSTVPAAGSAPSCSSHRVTSPTALRMVRAANQHSRCFVTPMAAVAGAVADEVLSAMTARRVTKASVNNGGDIAFHIAPGEDFRVLAPSGPIRVGFHDTARGIATSGWRGRSHSLGIADAATVLARTAAEADVAATLVANAVDLPGHPAIARTPAQTLNPDSDLGHRPVTTDVGPLTHGEIARALNNGAAFARSCIAKGTILAATLTLAGQTITITEKDLAHA